MGNSNSPAKMREILVDRPTVVIVGGGYGGVAVAATLDTQANVVLIDQKNHMFQSMGALRPCVSPEKSHEVLIPYDRLLTMGAFIQAKVERITSTEVVLAGFKESIKFDYCVIGTGSDYSFPMKHQLTMANEIPPMYEKCSNAIKDAGNIIIVGGGPVGIELLGEIAFIYPDKNITLIQGNEKILPGSVSDALRESLLTRIKNTFSKCKVVTGERVNITDEMKKELSESFKNNQNYLVGKREITTNKDSKFDADLVFFAMGVHLNDKAYKDFFKDSINSENGRLKCKPTMQVEGYENIFAIGDCADGAPQMAAMAGNRGGAGPHVSNNIIKHFLKQPNKMTQFSPGGAGMLVPLGPNQGAGQLPFGGKNGRVVGATITSKLKGAQLLGNYYWPDMGYKNISDKLINVALKDNNSQLTDDDWERLAKGVQMDVNTFKTLINEGTGGGGGVVTESKENKDDDANADPADANPTESDKTANENEVQVDSDAQMKTVATPADETNGDVNANADADADKNDE